MKIFYLYVMMMLVLCPAYLVSILYFVGYLRQAHSAVWANLGRPDITKVPNASIQVQFQQLQAFFSTWRFIFSNAHESLNDRHLSVLVWLLRFLISGCLLSFVGLLVVRP